VSKKILVSEALFRRLCEEGGLEGYRDKAREMDFERGDR
jgi:hypothetical protein